MCLYMHSVSSPPAVSLKDIIEEEQCQDSSNVNPVTEVRAFVVIFLMYFIQRIYALLQWY